MALAFITDKPLVGAGIGGGAAVLGIVAGDKVADLIPHEGAKNWLKSQPWAPGALLSAVAFGTLWFTKKKSAAVGSAVGSAIALAPAVYSSFRGVPAVAVPVLPPGYSIKNGEIVDSSGVKTTAFGIAVAESRGFGAPPSIDVFSEAPSNISLMGNANNADQALLPAASNPSVFGGASF